MRFRIVRHLQRLIRAFLPFLLPSTSFHTVTLALLRGNLWSLQMPYVTSSRYFTSIAWPHPPHLGKRCAAAGVVALFGVACGRGFALVSGRGMRYDAAVCSAIFSRFSATFQPISAVAGHRSQPLTIA